MTGAPDRTEGGEALTRLILRVFPFHGLLGAAGDDLTKPWGLTSARWKVLGAIAQAGGPLHVAQIARNMGQARQSVQRIVNDLEGDGLLALCDNPDHQRAHLVQMTSKGARVYGEVMSEQVRWSNDLADGLSPKALKSAERLIEVLCARIEQQEQRNEN